MRRVVVRASDEQVLSGDDSPFAILIGGRWREVLELEVGSGVELERGGMVSYEAMITDRRPESPSCI